MFTKTEALRRLRVLTRESRRYADGRRLRFEVGLRLEPQTASTALEAVDRRYPEGDDLDDFRDLVEAASEDEVRAHGALVHVYTRSWDGWEWTTDTICVGWMGTPDSEPVLLDHDGRLCTGLLEVAS